jgi:hypothetical protein
MEVTTEAITEAAREAATGRPPSPQTVWAVTRAGVVQNTRREPENTVWFALDRRFFYRRRLCFEAVVALRRPPPCLFQQPPNLPVERASSSCCPVWRC